MWRVSQGFTTDSNYRITGQQVIIVIVVSDKFAGMLADGTTMKSTVPSALRFESQAYARRNSKCQA